MSLGWSSYPVSALGEHYNNRAGCIKCFTFALKNLDDIADDFVKIENLVTEQQHPTSSPQSSEFYKSTEIFVTGE
jgi:hypothetical protein